MRLREWNETYRQLRMSLKDSKVLDQKANKKEQQKHQQKSKTQIKKAINKKAPEKPGEDEDKYLPKYDAIHQKVENLEAKARRRDILVDEEILYDFYDKLIPENIYSGPSFEKWRKSFERDNIEALMLTRDYLMQRDDSHVQGEQYPDHIKVAEMMLPLRYHFEPGTQDDGVTVRVPAAALPKQVRKQFVPAPEYAKACMESLEVSEEPIIQVIAEALRRMTGFEIDGDLLRNHQFSDHMKMRYEVVDESGKVIKTGRDLEKLKQSVGYKATSNLSKITTKSSDSIERKGIQEWDFKPLPETVVMDVSGMKIKAWPALVDEGDSVAIKLFDSPQQAQQQSGLLRLILLKFKDEQKAMTKSLPQVDKMCLYYASTGKCDELKSSIVKNVFRLNFIEGEMLGSAHGTDVNEEGFSSHVDSKRGNLQETKDELCQQLLTVLSLNHDIRKQLKGNIDFSLLEALNDVKDQLHALVYPGFLDELSMDELRQYPRYLKAILKRLDKLEGDAHKDRALRLQVQSLWDEYRAVLKKKGGSAKLSGVKELNDFRWMLEEFRVSLFAQDLGTAYPVSEKRLSAKWKELQTLTN
ncbi:ATP-dependent RNA helicase HrpA [Nymphon striatum]|nr:ATP-dependent RNA helicase HrpA [Nymphon striatum]